MVTINTVVISVTDLNDQTPTFNPTAGANKSVTRSEGATTAVDSFTITDTLTPSGLLLVQIRVATHLQMTQAVLCQEG